VDAVNSIAEEPARSASTVGTLPVQDPGRAKRQLGFSEPRPPALVVAAVCFLTTLCLILVILGMAPRVAAAAWGGVLLAGACFLSSRVGVAASILAVTLFNRDQLFTASIPLFGGGLKPTDLLLLATLAGWAGRQLLTRRTPSWVPVPIVGLSLGFVVWAVISAISGIFRGAFYKDSLLELRPLFQYTLILPILTEFSPADIRRLCRLILVAALAVAFKAVYLYVQGKGSEASYAGGAIRIMDVGFSPLPRCSV
jgi:hypothetical protein